MNAYGRRRSWVRSSVRLGEDQGTSKRNQRDRWAREGRLKDEAGRWSASVKKCEDTRKLTEKKQLHSVLRSGVGVSLPVSHLASNIGQVDEVGENVGDGERDEGETRLLNWSRESKKLVRRALNATSRRSRLTSEAPLPEDRAERIEERENEGVGETGKQRQTEDDGLCNRDECMSARLSLSLK